MTTNNRKVLMTVATGKQGGSVARRMRGNTRSLVALTRDPKSKAARALLEKGILLRTLGSWYGRNDGRRVGSEFEVNIVGQLAVYWRDAPNDLPV